eukprot:s562_g18.t1
MGQGLPSSSQCFLNLGTPLAVCYALLGVRSSKAEVQLRFQLCGEDENEDEDEDEYVDEDEVEDEDDSDHENENDFDYEDEDEDEVEDDDDFDHKDEDEDDFDHEDEAVVALPPAAEKATARPDQAMAPKKQAAEAAGKGKAEAKAKLALPVEASEAQPQAVTGNAGVPAPASFSKLKLVVAVLKAEVDGQRLPAPGMWKRISPEESVIAFYQSAAEAAKKALDGAPCPRDVEKNLSGGIRDSFLPVSSRGCEEGFGWIN